MGLKAWWRRNFAKDAQTFRDEEKVQAYVMAGGEFGSAVSMIYMGECIGFDKLLDHWETTEKAYAEMGFRTLSVDDFTGFGGWGRDIEALLRVPRKEGEKPVFHAAYYREHFFQKVGMHDAVKKAMQGEASYGTYAVPSTDHLKDH
jgi:hypothetical protein